jgi:tetratricopeptide (TPR) repeat protein
MQVRSFVSLVAVILVLSGCSPRSSHRPKPTATASTPARVRNETTPSPATNPNLARLYEEGLAAANSGRHDEALHCWEQLWSQKPDYRDVSELLKREYQVRGLEAFTLGDLDEAVRVWQQALAIDSQDRRTRAYIERANELRKRSTQILRD